MVKFSDVASHNSRDDCWLVVRGVVYDVTEFVPRHPGGFLIALGAGRDATQLFESHHPFSKKATEILQKYQIGELEDHSEQFSKQSKFYEVLKGRVQNYFTSQKVAHHDNTFMYLKTMLALLYFALSYYFTFFYTKHPVLQAIGAIIFGSSISNIGINVMHDGNHGGYSRNPTVNKLMGLGMEVMGASSYCWRQIHGYGHHVHTNVDPKDPDIYTHDPHFRRIKKNQSWYHHYKWQHIYLAFVYAAIIPELFFRDFVALAKGHYNSVVFQPMTWDEKLATVVGKLWCIFYSGILPCLLVGPCTAFLLISLAFATGSYILVLVFQVNHVTELCKFWHVAQGQSVEADWAELQAVSSSNFAPTSHWSNFWSGGLNNQIEHHLFPTVCHIHYTALSPIVQQTCQEFGIPYNQFPSFSAAVRSHWGILKRYGPQHQSYL
eukprot:TRINITY_DN16128_c0_g1_i1.p1 TRINITY_DN16128_c0_g1~~TRINITY_DN16128_c0_g1_i1.p1  ORF type:complete len:435 (-),score=50.64 TRINITY_DN16128_c0_g1_i1:2-1306(-)